METQRFDAIVIGSGSGLTVSSWAAAQGMQVAVIDEGPFGGTCTNRGCIPSKMLIHSADVAETVRRSADFGVESNMGRVHFSEIVSRVTDKVEEDARQIEAGNQSNQNITLFKQRVHFVGPHELDVDGQRLTSENIIIAAGSRPFAPPIPGLEGTPYMTSKEALRRTKQPKKLVIIGGGYIAVELGHFYGSLGTDVEIFEMGENLVGNEDEEVSAEFTKQFSAKYQVHTGAKVERVEYHNDTFTVHATGEQGMMKASGDALLAAVGVRSNSDLIKADAAGIELNERGYIKVNQYLETSVPGVWAFGDVVGKHMFKHSANWEANFVVQNAFGTNKIATDYTAIPHAVFSSPQMAGVGATEQELQKAGTKYKIGRSFFKNTAMGEAMQVQGGFVKALVDQSNTDILGCHIIGPDASTLIHEVVVAMKYSGKTESIRRSVHVHPALSEVVQRAFQAIH